MSTKSTEGVETARGNGDERNSGASEENPPIGWLNWLNLAFYVLNCLFTFGIGNFGIIGNGDNGTLSRKYQTIVTPAGWAFSIWSVIFVFQAIFVVVQFLPRFRAAPMVVDGVSYWYLLTCVFQIGWTFVFAYEILWLALIFIVGVWASLAAILYKQYYVYAASANSDGCCSAGGLMEFWLLRFPFAIHCGWLTAASLLNVNVVVVGSDASVPVELAVGIVSLAVLHAASVVLLTVPERPNYTVPCVLSWANGAISSELANTPESIKARFSEDSIQGVRYAAAAVAIIIIAQVVARAGFAIAERYKRPRTAGESVSTHEEGVADHV